MPDHHRGPPKARPLSPDELTLARELLESYRAARATGRAAKLMLVALAILAAGITAYDQIIGKVRQWLAP